MTEYQVTLFCGTGEYKPVSCIVKIDEQAIDGKELAKVVRKKGIAKICAKRYWSADDLKRLHYNKIGMRKYDKEKIEQQKKERYEQIKRERGWK